MNFFILLSFFELARHLRCLSVKHPLIYLFKPMEFYEMPSL